MRVYPGDCQYGQGVGHYETEVQQFRGPLTCLVGAGVCCCTCCPCGFCFPLDTKRTQVWVVDRPLSTAPQPQRMGVQVVTGPQCPQMDVQVVKVAQQREIIKVRCGGSCGQIVQVQPEGIGTVQFTCPHCQAVNQITYHGGITREEIELPHWWKVKPPMGQSELVCSADKDIHVVQTLFDQTWKEITTRDRNFKKPPLLQVVQVQQNCNPKLWSNYAHARQCIKARMTEQDIRNCKTSEVMESTGLTLGPLDASVNEFYLFHGTKPSACESICQSDFMIKMAGSNAGSLYGPGIYFGENSSKSDEYASSENSGIYQNLYAMLICRVTCGRMLYTDQLTPNTTELTQKCVNNEFNSVLGDREKARGTYREFIVFNNDQAYPEYVVIYRHIDMDTE